MDLRLLKLAIVIFAFATCGDKDITSELNGTWQLSTYQYGNNPEKVMPETRKRIKFITPGHFTWFEYFTGNNIVTASAGGITEFDGVNYTEFIDYAQMGMSNYLNQEQKFKIKLEDGKMYMEGFLSDSLKIKEVWLKLE